MLPPPITTAISSPSAATCAISPTMRSMVARLIPNESSPIRASPLSLSRMRLYFAVAAISAFCRVPCVFIAVSARAIFRSRPVALFLHPCANHVQDETRDRSAPRLEQRLDGLLPARVLDEGLTGQRHLLQEFLHASFDHFLHDVGGLA